MKKAVLICLTVMLLGGLSVSCSQPGNTSDISDALSENGHSSFADTSTTTSLDTSTVTSTENSSEKVDRISSIGTSSRNISSAKSNFTGVSSIVTSSIQSNTFDYTKYNLKTYIQPIWKGTTVYNETIMFVPDAKTKQIEPAPLLYTPTKILSVRSFDLKTEYKEGVDYVVSNGQIQLTENTRIPTWKYTDYYRFTADSVALQSKSAPGHYLKYGDASLVNKQVCVTYTHQDKWAGPIPTYAGDKLPNSTRLLSQKKPITIVYNGDSIVEGCDASGKLNIAPYMPTWPKMVTEELKKVYGGNITDINTAVGGTTSEWGLQNVQDNIIKHNPNLVVLRFGTNDGSKGMLPATYQSNIEQIISKVRQKNPDCEFLLISSNLPNPDAIGWTTAYHSQYQSCLEAIAAKTDGVAVAKVFDMEQYVQSKKRYWDTTANNINHPSDFLLRIYAQTIAQALVEEIQ